MTAVLPDPNTAPELFEGVLTRRVLAYIVDVAIIAAIVLVLTLVGGILGLLTLGLGWLATPVAIVIAIVGYYAVTLGAHRRATVGMQMMDLVLTPARGAPLNGFTAFAHPLLFWISIWVSWPVSFAIVLFTPRRQMLHDLVLGTLMLRRSPMERHWRAQTA